LKRSRVFRLLQEQRRKTRYQQSRRAVLPRTAGADVPPDPAPSGTEALPQAPSSKPWHEETAAWWSFVGYARLGLGGRFALCLRGEYFSDPDGARTGAPENLKEVTLTPEWTLSPHFTVRADLRIDWSDREVFETKDGSSRTQPTGLLNVFFRF
jgi:hypothetical protein